MAVSLQRTKIMLGAQFGERPRADIAWTGPVTADRAAWGDRPTEAARDLCVGYFAPAVPQLDL